MNNSSSPAQPWIRRSAFGFIAVGVGAMALTLLHMEYVHSQVPDTYELAARLTAFMVTLVGYVLLLQKYLHRRHVLLATRSEVSWRHEALNQAPCGALIFQGQDKPFCNDTLLAWLGAQPSTAQLLSQGLAQGQDLAKKVIAADEEQVHEKLIRLQNLAEAFTLETTLQHESRPVRMVGQVGSGSTRLVWLFDMGTEKAATRAWGHEKAALQAELAKLTVITQAVPRPLWLRKLSGQIVWVNQAFADAVEKTPAEVVRDGLEFSPRVGVAAARALAQQAVATGTAQSEDRHVVVGGTRKLYRVSEIPVIVEGYVIGLALDQTEVEEIGLELSRHISAFEETLEQVGAPIAIYGPDQSLQFYNQAYQRLWQFNEAFLRAHPTYSDVLEDLRERRKLPEVVDFARYRRERLGLFTSLIETLEEMWHLPDGTTIRHLAIPHPLGGLMFVTEDVTDKLALESSYNTLIAVQQETLDNLAEGIAVIGSDGRLKLSNPAFAQIWNLLPEALTVNPHVNELLDQMRALLGGALDWEALKPQMASRMIDRTPRDIEEITRADSSVIEHASVPLPDGNILHSYLDVTARTRVEAALRATNRALAAADKLKSEFVANVSYQLRTPLSTIIGFAEILTNQYFGELNERQLDYAKTILEASRKLLALINTVLDLATIEAGRMMLSRRPVALSRLFADAMNAVMPFAERQQLVMALECPDDLPEPEIDERRMNQVLMNLLTNAVQYTPPGGTVTLAARYENPFTIITVTDTGIGMTAEEAERVFNKFERANPQARQPGVGLGLSLAKSLVELHGGRIELYSQVNGGTRVILTLPTRAAAVENAGVTSTSAAQVKEA